MSAIEHRKWKATIQGLSPVRTVMPPTMAWAAMPTMTTQVPVISSPRSRAQR